MKMTHIPFKSAADIVREIAVGSVQVGLTPLEGSSAAIAGGRVRALAVTGSRRLESLRDVPSMVETGIKGLEGIEPYTYYALAGPAGLPPAVVAKLSDTLNAVSKMPDVIAQVRERVFNEPATGTPATFRKFVEDDFRKWRQLGQVIKLTD
jgi:tripartite-type tricarboxylate transporter receptor subunit TctC